jgi:hypothetical protein
MVTEPVATLDAAPSDPGLDLAAAQGTTTGREIVALVGVQLVGSLPWPSDALLDRQHGVDQRLEELAVVPVGRCEDQREWDAVGIGEQMTLRALPAAVRGVRPGRFTPLFAANEALSMQARLQSMAFALPSRSSSTRCSRAHTPAACQSRNLRQQVMPDPQPISWGKCSQPMPVRKTNTMPARQARSGTRGRPPLGLAGSGGRSGPISCHNSLETRGATMLGQQRPDRQVPF